ncbi:jerky protein homolog-like [Halictus rubicundus]|uniref:jerky protein homolog-like n=1 Tax=Halictus rubicundus TaxID=77578 RepID=UPI0040365E17
MAKKQDKARIFLSVQDKIKIAEQSEKGVPTKELCRKYGVSSSVIYRIRRECTHLTSFGSRGGCLLQHKNRRTSPNVELENRLYTWFLEQQVMDNPLTDVLLQKKARELCGQFASTPFNASGGWLRNFKNRYRIHLVRVHGEKGKANDDGAKAFLDAFMKRIEEEKLNLSNIYNMEETSLLWKTIPSKTLISEKKGILAGEKQKRDRVSIGLCANADGTHKLPPIFIHNFKNLRAQNWGPPPVIYKYQPQAWMNLQIFNEWYEEVFKPSVRQYQLANGIVGKVLLLVDNCANHKRIYISHEDDNFEIVYLPAKTTSFIRPMDQGIIAKLKNNYRHKILRRILQLDKGLEEFYVKYSIKDCIYLLNELWNDITAANIKNGWNDCLCKHSGGEEENLLNATTQSQMSAMIHIITGEENSPEDFMEILRHLECEETINVEDIEENIIQDEEEDINIKIERDEGGGETETLHEAEPLHEAVPLHDAGLLHEAGPSHKAGPSYEAGPSDAIGLSHKVELNFIEEEKKYLTMIEDGLKNFIEEKKTFLSLVEDGLKKFAKNNQTLLSLGEALLRCLENEAPQIQKNHP